MMPRAGRGGQIARAALSRRPVALATAILCLLPLALTAQPVPDEERPRIALVLSGGGARGAAHVGVLKVLEELQIPVDMVVGTSMGSIVGGLYAAGMSPDQIQEAMLHTDWTSAFRDRPPREERYFPRKEDDAEYVVPYELHFASGHPRFPLGLLPAQKLQNLLKYFEVSTGASNDFDELPLPYRAVATDLSNGERVVLDRGSLAVAMRASMSVPGIFPPVPIGDHLLIDGGVSSNLPIEVARELGPAHVIAIDISTPLDTDPLLDSPVSVIRRLSAFLIQGNVTRSGETLEAADLLIRPDLGDVRASRFDQVGIAMELGEAAAREHLAELRRYSVDRETWEAWRDDQRHEPDPTPTVAEIRVRNDSPLNDAIILEHLRFAVGEPLDIDALNEGLSALYGLDLFEPITFEATPGQDGLVLTFDVRRRLTGLTQGLFNLTIEDDFEGGTAYSARMRLQRLGANRRGGEWRVDLGVGQESGLEAEFLQPIDPGLRWFASTEGVVRRVDDYITSDGLRLAQYRVTETTGTLSLGRHLGHWGRARIGVEWTDSQAEIEVPEDLIAPVQEQAAGWFTELAVDTLDAPVWPSRGARGTIRYTDRGDYLGGELEASTLSVLGNAAFQLGGLSLVPGVELQLDLGTASDGSDGGVLGGLFRLSGLAPTEVFGDELVLARVVGYRELGPRAFRIIKPGWFLGGSFEAGNAWPKAESIDLDELILAGSVFIGGDTFAGPVRIGAGFAEGGRIRFFLSVGRGFL